jgi:hypothetical protein
VSCELVELFARVYNYMLTFSDRYIRASWTMDAAVELAGVSLLQKEVEFEYVNVPSLPQRPTDSDCYILVPFRP